MLSSGCDDFMRKPFRAEEIFEMLKKYLGVRFIYANDQLRAAGQANKARSELEDLPSAISKLPATLVAQLRERVELGDMAQINESIAEIRQIHPALAETLSHLTYQFEYDRLLSLLRRAVP